MADADHSPLLLLVTGATGKVGINFIAHLEAAAAHAAAGDVAVLCDAAGVPLKRSFLHVDDLSAAICAALDNPRVRGEGITIAMDEPVDYGSVARALVEGGRAKGAAVKMATAYHSVWLDNAKAKLLLGDGWRPRIDARTLAERAWDFVRAEGDKRIVFYPG